MTNKRKPKSIRRLYTMCNLPVLRCADSETADLIYLDPSFNFEENGKAPPMKRRCPRQIILGLRVLLILGLSHDYKGN